MITNPFLAYVRGQPQARPRLRYAEQHSYGYHVLNHTIDTTRIQLWSKILAILMHLPDSWQQSLGWFKGKSSGKPCFTHQLLGKSL